MLLNDQRGLIPVLFIIQFALEPVAELISLHFLNLFHTHFFPFATTIVSFFSPVSQLSLGFYILETEGHFRSFVRSLVPVRSVGPSGPRPAHVLLYSYHKSSVGARYVPVRSLLHRMRCVL